MKVTKFSRKYIGAILKEMNKNSVKKFSNEYVAQLLIAAEGSKYGEKRREFLNLLINKVDKNNYFIIPPMIPGEPSIGVVNSDLNAIMFLTLNTTNPNFMDYFKSELVLDLLHLHSFKIGEGRKLMKLYKEIHKDLNVPGLLFTETRKNVRYFTKHGFKSLGQLGVDNEYLMILEKSLH